MRGTARVLPRGIPDCLKKRRLLNEKALDPALCRDYGERFLALGWWEDALEFFLKGADQGGLDKIREKALEAGDAHLLARVLGRKPDPDLWRRAAERALALGKLQFARQALESAGDRERAAALAQGLKADYRETDI
jgi:hypothetical protein